MDKTETEGSEIFISHIHHPCQNLAPTLPTMQFDSRQFGDLGVMLVAANVAETRSGLQRSGVLTSF